MKKKFLLILLISVTKLMVAQESISLDSSYANGYYVERLAFFELLPNTEDQIVFLGNSITEVGDWQEVVQLPHVVNRGISGDNSYGVFYRLDEVLASQPAKVFLMIGVNDIKRGTPIPNILKNFERIAKKVSKDSPKTKLYFQSVLPVTEYVLASIYEKITNEKIAELNKGIRKIAKEYGVEYINLQIAFADPDGNLKRELTTDGLHLKPASYILWVRQLKEANYL